MAFILHKTCYSLINYFNHTHTLAQGTGQPSTPPPNHPTLTSPDKCKSQTPYFVLFSLARSSWGWSTIDLTKNIFYHWATEQMQEKWWFWVFNADLLTYSTGEFCIDSWFLFMGLTPSMLVHSWTREHECMHKGMQVRGWRPRDLQWVHTSKFLCPTVYYQWGIVTHKRNKCISDEHKTLQITKL